jgi:hypothetical protein
MAPTLLARFEVNAQVHVMTSPHDIGSVIVISTALGILLLAALVLGIVCAVTSGFFGDEPGGRDPNLRGEFIRWEFTRT